MFRFANDPTLTVDKRESRAGLARELVKRIGVEAVDFQHRQHVGLLFQLAKQRLLIGPLGDPRRKNIDGYQRDNHHAKHPSDNLEEDLSCQIGRLTF